MANTEALVHSMFVRGTCGTVALTDTLVGNITLPASEDGWKIYGAWGYGVINAALAAEATFGHMRVESVSGDILPNPSPCRLPLAGVPSYLGAATGKPLVPLTLWRVEWEASGKAVIGLHYVNESAKSTGDDVCLGLIFGKVLPEPRPIIFMDRVTAAVAAVGTTLIGTINLAERATRITGIGCQVVQDMVSTAAQEILPYFILTSDDVDFAPAQWPCQFASCVGLATNHGLNNAIVPELLPVDIPIIGGARINCSINFQTAVTNAAQVQIYIAYE